jgi:hypothetical protein
LFNQLSSLRSPAFSDLVSSLWWWEWSFLAVLVLVVLLLLLGQTANVLTMCTTCCSATCAKKQSAVQSHV